MAKKARKHTQETEPAVKLCMIEGCGKPVKFRGLCRSCYQCAHRLVKKGDYTWEQLIGMDMALDEKRGGMWKAAIGKKLAARK